MTSQYFHHLKARIVSGPRYGPFGETLRSTGLRASKCNWKFATKYADSESGFAYYGCRYYIPPRARWASRDPIDEDGGSALYAFVGNNSPNAVDPIGLEVNVYPSVLDPTASDSLAQKIQSGFQTIIGDCARVTVSQTERTWTKGLFMWSRTVKETVYRISYVEEKQNGKCKCDDCWQVLKKVLDADAPRIWIRDTNRDLSFFGGARADYTGKNRDVTFGPDDQISEQYEIDPSRPDDRGSLAKQRFEPVLWHEAVAHAGLGLTHPRWRNNPSSFIPIYDPTIREENRARNCMRKLNIPIMDRQHQYYHDMMPSMH